LTQSESREASLDLLERAKAGDRQALEALITRSRRILQRASSQEGSPSNPTAAFSMRLRMQLASLERQTGHIAEAEAIEASLRKRLAFADRNHPIARLLSRE